MYAAIRLLLWYAHFFNSTGLTVGQDVVAVLPADPC